MLESTTNFVILGLIIPVIFLAIYCLKKIMLVRLTGNQHIKIINQISIGSKERLLLLKINEEIILVGVTPHKISKLHVCNDMSDFT